MYRNRCGSEGMFWNTLQSTWRFEKRLLEKMLPHDSICINRKRLEKYMERILPLGSQCNNVRITVRIIAWALEKDITNAQRMRITRSFKWLELLKYETYEISARDIQKSFREFKNRNSFLWTNAAVINMLTLPWNEVFVDLWNPVKNNCFPFCNASPKKKSELSPAREESTLITHATTNPPSQMCNIGKVLFQFQIGGCWQ